MIEDFQSKLNAQPTTDKRKDRAGGFGDFSGDIQTHASVSFLNEGEDAKDRLVCIGLRKGRFINDISIYPLEEGQVELRGKYDRVKSPEKKELPSSRR